MAYSRDRRKEEYQRNKMRFLSKAFFETTSHTRVKQESESRKEKSKLFISSLEPLHLKGFTRPKALQKTFKSGAGGYFPVMEISALMNAILQIQLQNESYNEDKCRLLSRKICSAIQAEIKKLHPPRYKSVCYVHIGQIKGQDMVIASRCLWDTNVDNFAQAQYKNSSLFATVSVFGFYYE